MSQASFGAEIGYSESYINAVESRDKESSQEMRARIYQSFGALILSDQMPAQAFTSEARNLEPYIAASFQEHRRSYKPGWEAFLAEEVIEVFKFMPKAPASKASATGDQSLTRAVRLHMQGEAQKMIKQFGLREQFRNKILALKDSPIHKDIKLCHLLCSMTDSNDLAANLRSLPEFEALRSRGITVGGKPATIGEWFESQGEPAE